MKINLKMVDDLIKSPLCKAEDLGKAIPASEHANSVCLPRWVDNVGYEEGDPVVVDRLTAGLRKAADAKRDFATVPQENPTVKKLYRELLDRPGSETARKLLYFHKVKL